MSKNSLHLDADACYRALAAHDARFDGLFFVCVRTTGIYCRPICSTHPPLQKNCTFQPSSAACEKAGYRPCLRCRPERAPGYAPVDALQRLAISAASLIESGYLDDGHNLENLAEKFGVTSRHLRRAIDQVFGVSPIELAQTHRLLTAKRLLTETNLTAREIALTSGFGSVRRFNDLFLSRYRLPPTRIRGPRPLEPVVSFRLGYRPPFAWDAALAFLSKRAVQGVERITPNSYTRTIQRGTDAGLLTITNDEARAQIKVDLSPELLPHMRRILPQVRRMFDLDARPDLIETHLGDLITDPGLRVIGAFEPFEVACRAIIGQQVSVPAATTIMNRLVCAFGEEIPDHPPDLNRIAPTAAQLALKTVGEIAGLGMPGKRAETLIRVAELVATGEGLLETVNPEEFIANLVAIPGIGPWTAHYLAIRLLGWSDAFPADDLVLRQAAGNITATELTKRAEQWRPWRAYAAVHLWHSTNLPKP
ncbi:MAG: helix-turn-helix domain-containing protein [Armatimonadetes bacterium]|nr:helix-turn-helix domain-containing protein [Armatimonadota bacterium]